MSQVMPPLGRIAEEHGAYQGMSGLVDALRLNVTFRISEERLSPSEIRRRLRTATALWRSGCSERVDFPGPDFSPKYTCMIDPEPFIQEAVHLNYELFGPMVLDNAAVMYAGIDPSGSSSPRNQPAAGRDALDQDAQTLRDIERTLRNGRMPLLHYVSPQHVVGVVAVESVPIPGEATTDTYRVLQVMDPNLEFSRRLVLRVDAQGRPTSNSIFVLRNEIGSITPQHFHSSNLVLFNRSHIRILNLESRHNPAECARIRAENPDLFPAPARPSAPSRPRRDAPYPLLSGDTFDGI